jgi:hypothetical protein
MRVPINNDTRDEGLSEQVQGAHLEDHGAVLVCGVALNY